MAPPTAHLARRFPLVVAVALAAAALVAAGCGERSPAGSSVALSPAAAAPLVDVAPARSGDDVALVATEDGLAGVVVGSGEPLWVEPGAVAAPDGSAVFAVRDGAGLVRIDPWSGAATVVAGRAPGPVGAHVAAVQPGGTSVVLAGRDGDATVVVDVDTATGEPRTEQRFDGVVEPEAFSLDHTLLFAARVYEDRYHVHVLNLATGTQEPTLGPDKSATPEDMYGSVVQAVLSPDGAQLATLYRDSSTPRHTAFVHLLSLETGFTVCIDLHEPFGTGPAGSDAIEWRHDGTVVVGHTGPGTTGPGAAGPVSATFDPASIWSGDPQPHYHADAAVDPDAPRLPGGLTDVEGFRRFVAMARVG